MKRVSVVGAGIMGSCAAWRMAERGWKVTVWDQFEPGHGRGSSHGRSRIVRKAYPDPRYTAIMREGYPMWHELRDRSGVDLLHECGLLYFGDRSSPNLATMATGLKDLGVDHAVLEGEALRRKFRGEGDLDLRTTGADIGVWQPEAGWVHAERAARAALDLARTAGAEVRLGLVEDLADLEGDAIVVCAGPWIGRFADLPVTVTRQTFTYIEARHTGPVWIEDSPHNLYGFPLEEPTAEAIKLAAHCPGPAFDPDRGDREPTPEDAELALDLARRRWGIAEPRIVEQGVCLYTTTPDEHFRLGRIDRRTVYASPCSGHGFKFGPWIGRALADMVEGKAVAIPS